MKSTKLLRKFKEFHRDNPDVYTELVKLAKQLKAKGRSKYGIKSLFEVVRWHRALATTGDEFKLNNNYTAYYARLIMHREPSLKGFFSVRELPSQK